MKMKKSSANTAAQNTRGNQANSNAAKVENIKQRFNLKQLEVRTLISDVKDSLDEIGGHIRDEKLMLMQDIKFHKAKLSEVLGYGDEVRGFDNLVWDDQVEQLDIYAEFLGPQEYNRVKSIYEKTLNTMEQLYQAEIQSLNYQEQPV